jgi:NCAIR mutase (PurE)-related protein
MNEKELLKLLYKVANGEISVEDSLAELKEGPFNQAEIGHTAFDYHRRLRQGLAEVIFAEPKSIEQIEIISRKFKEVEYPILYTRIKKEHEEFLLKEFTTGRLNKVARTFLINPPKKKDVEINKPFVALFSAGTGDAFVIEEAAEVCLAMEVPYIMKNDVGVAGIHRLFQHTELIQKASAIVVVAGMEGALPSVIGGIAEAPVFAVPTSVGYGASFNGLSALLGMLNSCASGVTVSNIDNGFSAAFSACQVVRQIIKRCEE